MKTRTSLFIALLMLNCSISQSQDIAPAKQSTGQSVNILTSPDLYTLVAQWAGEYATMNPAQPIQVINSTESNIAKMLDTGTGLACVSDNYHETGEIRTAWSMTVGRDVIVPVMSARNPMLQEIYRKGMTSSGLRLLLTDKDRQDWGSLLGNSAGLPLHLYSYNDAAISDGIARLINGNSPPAPGTRLPNAQEMIAAIQKDPNGFGFCKLTQLLDPVSQQMITDVKLVPIDKNGNGKIDYMEDIYASPDDFARGVWIGKYEKALTGNIYLVSKEEPKSEAERAFLLWVLTDGQQLLASNGFSALVFNERQTRLNKLTDTGTIIAPQEAKTNAGLKIMVLALFFVLIAGVLMSSLIRRFRDNGITARKGLADKSSLPDEQSLLLPKGLYFDKGHTWAFMDKDGTVKVGLDDFIQHITGPLTRIDMKNPGEKVKKGGQLFTIVRKGKQLNIKSPVTGTIVMRNRSLATNPAAVNATPYTDGWVYQIEPANWLLEIQFMQMADTYRVWLRSEMVRLRDFFAAVLKDGRLETSCIVLQDGGALHDGILSELSPEVWEEFQIRFIDTAR